MNQVSVRDPPINRPSNRRPDYLVRSHCVINGVCQCIRKSKKRDDVTVCRTRFESFIFRTLCRQPVSIGQLPFPQWTGTAASKCNFRLNKWINSAFAVRHSRNRITDGGQESVLLPVRALLTRTNVVNMHIHPFGPGSTPRVHFLLAPRDQIELNARKNSETGVFKSVRQSIDTHTQHGSRCSLRETFRWAHLSDSMFEHGRSPCRQTDRSDFPYFILLWFAFVSIVFDHFA